MLEPFVRHLESDLRSCQYTLGNQELSFDEFLELESHRTIAQTQYRNLRDAVLSRRHSSVLQWLSTVNVESRYEDAAKLRHEGTGHWLFEHARFEEWFNIDYCIEPMFWLSGIPGSGGFRISLSDPPTDKELQVRRFWHLSLLMKPDNYQTQKQCSSFAPIAIRSVMALLL
jgi:hypothetical protein